MTDPGPSAGPNERTSPSPTPGRRPRAPTITIDTKHVRRPSDASSNMDPNPQHELDNLSDDGKSINGDRPANRRPSSHAQLTPLEVRGSNSFDSRESRPTSPHNISSPSQWANPHAFLAVPTSRSRGASFDSEADSNAGSDFTYVNSSASNNDAPSKASSELPQLERPGQVAELVPDEEALKPDPGTEADFERENNPFAFTPGQMSKLLNPKSLSAFHALGGLAGLEKGLRTNRHAGLSLDEQSLEGNVSFEEATAVGSPSSDTTLVDEQNLSRQASNTSTPFDGFTDRRRIFDDNHLPERRVKNIFQLMWIAYNDKVLIVLTVAAVIALALGIYQAIDNGGVEWIEGVAIIVAIVVVVVVGAVNDWQKERQFAKLNKKKEDRNVKLFRSGKTREVNIHDILVGDVLLVEPGDILPVDGVFISGHGLKCDESSATGESDLLKKTSGDDAFAAMESHSDLRKIDPFMISGAKVTEGYGRMLVTATGVNSSYGKTILSLQESNDMTPLQAKLNKLAEYIAKLGSAAALLLFIVLFIKFLAQLPNDHTSSGAEKAQHFMTILITAITIIVVAVPEGLPLAVTLALAYATRRMLADNNLVRVLRSCETMGNATTVCSDKTGTLTQNVMTVVAGSLGTANRFRDRSNTASESATEQSTSRDAGQTASDAPASEFILTITKDVKNLWKDSIAINSTAFEKEQDGKQAFVGSKTETALLDFARLHLAMDNVSVERSNAEVAQVVPFDSKRKCMAMVMKLPDGRGHRLLVKGASEIMLRYCSQIIRDPTKYITATTMTADNKRDLEALINVYAGQSLRTIGFIFRDFESTTWPPNNVKRVEDDRSQALFESMCKDMTFLGLVGIQDPLRPGVTDAVRDCVLAGVFPRMVTGDNILTAKAIATECGIFTPGGLALEGPEFRKMSKIEQQSIIPKLQVLARSSPDDKRTLVKRLKELGETVAVTGDGTNDAPALKAADVGFSMNIAGTEVAKEASDIILMDDNFASIVNALMWGRAVNDAVRKFLQFQITVNITAVLLAFISAVSSDEEESVLSAVQLLWVNLIMDTMAALALATDPPTRKILDRKPDSKSAPLISATMWKMVIGQAIYQLVVTLVLFFAGKSILGYSTDLQDRQLQTLIFNTFVWMQIFNALNNRRLDNHFNVFEGVFRNWLFCIIFLIMIGGQVLIIFVGGWAAFQAERQTGAQWGIALILGAISLPIGVIVRLIPDELVIRLVPPFIREWSSRKKDKVVITDEENHPFEFNPALYEIRDELTWLKRYKGGRLNALRFTITHPKEAFMHSRSPSRTSSSLPRTPNNESVYGEDNASHSPAPPTPESRHRRRGHSKNNSAFIGAAMAGIVAGSVAGGWSPIERGHSGDGDSLRFARGRSKSDLSREYRIEAHPTTTKQDGLVVKSDPAEAAGGQPPSQSVKTTPDFEIGPYAGEPSSSKKGKENLQVQEKEIEKK